MESEGFMSPILATSALSVVFLVLFAMLVIEAPFAERLRVVIEGHTQILMLLVAAAAMASSLYYSEVVGFIPCEFCWYQRIAMYSLAVLLLVSVATRVRFSPRYIITLAGAGLLISIYHYQLQLFPEQAGACSGIVACTDKNVEQFGFVTIPFMAGCGFLSVLLLQVAEWRVRHLYQRWYGSDVTGEASAAS